MLALVPLTLMTLATFAAGAAHAQCTPRLVAGPLTSVDGDVREFATFHRDGVQTACVVGNFRTVNGLLTGPAIWWQPHRARWGPMGDIVSSSSGCCAGPFSSVCVFDDGAGPALYAGGACGVCRWSGAAWRPLGDFVGPCTDLTVATINGVRRLIAASGGQQHGVWGWTGTAWVSIGSPQSGLRPPVAAVFDSPQTGLIALGSSPITTPGSTSPANHGARWNGLAWEPLAATTTSFHNIVFNACALWHDDGSPDGGAMYLCGPQGGSLGGVWRYSSDGWRTAGGGLRASYIFDLAEFDDGTRARPRLFAGGNGMHAWDGQAWEVLSPDIGGSQPPPGQIGGNILALHTFAPDPHSRPILLIGGSRFMQIDGRAGLAYLTSCAPCPADFDNSGLVTVQDLFSYLQAWFPRLPAAEFDGVPGVDLEDLFAYLAAWHVGCL